MEYNGITDANVEQHDDTMFISIVSPVEPDLSKKDNSDSYFKECHSNVKVMSFGDYMDSEAKSNPNVFTKEQAKELYEFIIKNKDKKMAILHCGAGISRSGAIGTFLFENFGDGNYEEFKRKNPQICPNPRVLRLLNECKK